MLGIVLALDYEIDNVIFNNLQFETLNILHFRVLVRLM